MNCSATSYLVIIQQELPYELCDDSDFVLLTHEELVGCGKKIWKKLDV